MITLFSILGLAFLITLMSYAQYRTDERETLPLGVLTLHFSTTVAFLVILLAI